MSTPPLMELSPVDRDILRMLAAGATHHAVGSYLGITKAGASKRIARLRERSGATCLLQLMVWAAKWGIV